MSCLQEPCLYAHRGGKHGDCSCRTEADELAVLRFHRNVLRNAMTKSFIEEHHRSWRPHITCDLLTLAVAYSVMCASALQCLLDDSSAQWASCKAAASDACGLAELVASMLEMLAWIIEPSGSFSKFFLTSPVPGRGCHSRVVELLSVAEDDCPGWAALAAIQFDALDGWRLLCKVRWRTVPQTVSLRTQWQHRQCLVADASQQSIPVTCAARSLSRLFSSQEEDCRHYAPWSSACARPAVCWRHCMLDATCWRAPAA
jgi:hypothetical protein